MRYDAVWPAAWRPFQEAGLAPFRRVARRILGRPVTKRPVALAKPWLYVHEAPEEQRVARLEGRYPDSRVLIVATGPSAEKILAYDDRLHDRWDVVVALNGSVEHVRNMDVFLSVESKAYLWDWFQAPTPPNVIRCVSESSIRLAREAGHPEPQPALYLLRHVYEHPVDIRHYRNAQGEEGLLSGPRGETGLGPGTVTLQAIHLAAMFGAREIDLIGADLHFRGEVQHFYGGKEYGTHEVDGKRYHRLDVERRLNPNVVTTHPGTGREVETTLHFRESANFIDTVIREHVVPAGIRIRDFSDGLISTVERADIDEVMAS